MNMNTRESLGIFWTFEEFDESGETVSYQDEVDGLIFYGYWKKSLPEELLDPDSISKLWKGADIQTKLIKWDEESYNCYSIEIYIKTWPEESFWEENIKCSLLWFCKQGAVLSWCGAEDCSPSTDVFDPDLASGNVYAAYAPKVGFICNSPLYGEYQELQDEQLLQFKNILV